MRADWPEPLDAVLSAGGRVGLQSGADAPDRPAVHEDALLRLATDDSVPAPRQAIHPKHKTGAPAPGHRHYPYLLRGIQITRPCQVWSSDITYIPMRGGFLYLAAIIDRFSRYVLAWQLSNTLDGLFCRVALRQALAQGTPEIFNTDQGAQFTADEFTGILEGAGILISMDGRGRALDNIFVERLWRTVKYEHIYLHDYDDVPALATGLHGYFRFYNYERPHQSLGYRTPAEVHHG